MQIASFLTSHGVEMSTFISVLSTNTRIIPDMEVDGWLDVRQKKSVGHITSGQALQLKLVS